MARLPDLRATTNGAPTNRSLEDAHRRSSPIHHYKVSGIIIAARISRRADGARPRQPCGTVHFLSEPPSPSWANRQIRPSRGGHECLLPLTSRPLHPYIHPPSV